MIDGIDIPNVRAQFPSLAVSDDGRPRIHFDNPAGTQAPRRVIDRITGYMARNNANRGGPFVTSRDSDSTIEAARAAMAAFLGAASPEEIVFGPNMTSLTFHVARALAPRIGPGDEILVTRMDHDGNVTPWRQLAERTGARLKWWDFDPATYRFDLADLSRLVSRRTKIAAIGYASNILGTINDVAGAAAIVRAAGGLTYVDAVQFAPHGEIDVQAIGCDFLACSAYKFYGPHVGVLWGRRALLEDLRPEKLTASSDAIPSRYEVGTQNHEGIAGVLGAAEYFAELGSPPGEAAAGAAAFRGNINRAKHWMRLHEEALAVRLIDGLGQMPGVRIHGLTGANQMAERVSTISCSVDGRDPGALAEILGSHNIFVWGGHNYALELVASLGLADAGGVLRIGPVHYNTEAEVDRVLAVLDETIGASR